MSAAVRIPFNIRVKAGEKERWVAAARASGMSLSEWVRRSLNDRVDGRDPAAMTRRLASGVLTELLPEIERVLEEQFRASPTPSPPDGESMPVMPLGPRPFDPSCYEADLHRNGVVCSGCGGSMVAKR